MRIPEMLGSPRHHGPKKRSDSFASRHSTRFSLRRMVHAISAPSEIKSGETFHSHMDAVPGEDAQKFARPKSDGADISCMALLALDIRNA